MDYTLHPVNLDSKTGRGIAVYAHKSLDKSIIQIKPAVSFEEACLLEVKLRGGDVLLFGCFYRSPTKSMTSDENNTKLNQLLQHLSLKKYSHKLFVGDFNFKLINWKTWTTPANEESMESTFLETVKDCFLHQHIDKATRRRGNDDPSLLDLVFSDEEMQVSDLMHHAPLGKSDHSVITFNFHCYLNYGKPKERLNYSKGDYQSMLENLSSTNWAKRFVEFGRNRSVEELCGDLKLKFAELTNEFVPKTTISNQPTWRDKGFPINQEARTALQEKSATHRKWISNRYNGEGPLARTDFTRSRNKVRRLLRKAKRNFERNVAENSKVNPKLFWSYARRKLKTKTGIAPLLENKDKKDSLKFDDEEKANILSDQFSSVFSVEPEGDIPKINVRTDSKVLELIITVDMVLEALQKLNVNKSVGPDGIHPRLLKELAEEIASPITLIFNKSITEGKLPNEWKEAFISSIYKKGSKNLAENYRPISLTSILCKVLESQVRETVLNHLQENKLLSAKQYGFIGGRSTALQLLYYLDSCVRKIAEGKVVDTVYFDFAKAFDKVPHRRLLGKLEAYGISGSILNWIREFLCGRTQTVVVNGEKSKKAAVLSGIPQGTVLGPLLFVIYINDILDGITSSGLLFADDTKIFREVTSEEDSLRLQADIERLEQWAKVWLLEFNQDKCHVITLGKLENIKHTHRYRLGGKEIEHVFEEKDLGVIVDHDLSFSEHISSKIRIANAIVGLIRRSFAFLDIKTFTKLYTAFVRPHLEYAQSAWSPITKKHVNALENVQIRATKLIDGLGHLDYPERLKVIDLPTLRYRRMRGDMIEVYKHCNTYDADIISPSFQKSARPSRQHNSQLIQQRRPRDGVTGLETNCFYNRTIETWNELPRNVAEAEDITEFKINLD